MTRNAPAVNFKVGDRVEAQNVSRGTQWSNAIIMERASYGGGYYAAFDPPNPNCTSFWTCDTYLRARQSASSLRAAGDRDMASEAKWEAHTGLDYTVVMLPGEMTETASIHVYGDDAPALAVKISALPDLLEAARILASLEDCEGVLGGRRFPTKEECKQARAALARAEGQG